MNTQKFSRLRAQRDALHASFRQLSGQRRELLEEIHRFEAQAHEFKQRGFDLSAADKASAAEKREQLNEVSAELGEIESHWQSAATLIERCEKYLEGHHG